MTVKRKLIEVALPLEAINRESAREKSIRHGHPSTLHLWWARRPLAAARAVLFAQLVDDPSSDDSLTEEEQRVERARLHKMIEDLVVWENTRDEKLLAAAHQEILKSTGGNPPPILDPFAGGGTIPLEAQRLGLEAHASDLNPVAVLINKALIEIPPKFRDQPPVFPGLADTRSEWKGAEGLAADVRAYGNWMRDQAQQRIGHLYPKATLPDGTTANVIAWIWARTITCPNPACGIEAPLVRSWWLGKKKGKEAYIIPTVVEDPTHPSGKRVHFSIGRDPAGPATNGTIKSGAVCLSCGSSISAKEIRIFAQRNGLGSTPMAVVAQGSRQRVYLEASDLDSLAIQIDRPEDAPTQMVPTRNHDVDRLPMYGMPRWSDAFTPRQLNAMCAFTDLVSDVHMKCITDLEKVQTNSDYKGVQYAQSLAVLLTEAVSRCADYWSSLCSWHNGRETIRNVFGRQAVPMVWDFAEVMPFSEMTGGFTGQVDWVAKAVEAAPASGNPRVSQEDATTRDFAGFLISTDPPYYDNISYSDLSDYFYVWQKRSLVGISPELFSTILTPKSAELVANPYRHKTKGEAKKFFEEGFKRTFSNARVNPLSDYPITVYYAFKQTESDQIGAASTGWETLLEGMIQSGWQITATWPMRSEMSNRMVASGANALASSIVLSLRPRPDDAPRVDRRGFIKALQSELPDALRKLQQGAVAPVDLPQAAIGPGMAVFSRYSGVIEPDGSKMTVRSALARINEILDEVLNEQEGDLDPTSRFAIAWFKQHAYEPGSYGDADSLARARNTSVDVMDRDEILRSRAGKVQLLRPAELSGSYEVLADAHTSNWEAAHHIIRILETEGIAPAGVFLRQAMARPDGAVDPDQVTELAHLLYRVCEGNSWTKEALAFNTLVTSWPDIVDASRTAPAPSVPTQAAFDFTDEDN